MRFKFTNVSDTQKSWLVGLAAAIVTLALGYYFAVYRPLEVNITFPGLLLGFAVCGLLLRPPQSR